MPVVSSERPEYSLDAITSAPTKPVRGAAASLPWVVLALCVLVAAMLGYFVL